MDLGEKMKDIKIGITSDSFSFHPQLKKEILALFPQSKFKQDKTKFTKTALIEYLKDCDGAVIGLEKIDVEIINALPNLKIISKYGVGIDNLDLNYMRTKNIALGWTAGLNKNSVSELAVGKMISMARNLFTCGLKLKNGVWEKDGGRELSELTVGILGVGHIGKEVIKKLQVFGCKIVAYDIIEMNQFFHQYSVERVSSKDLFRKADIVSIHIPLNDSTSGLIDAEVFASMKQGSMFLNTSRGGIVDEEALYQNLVSGKLHAASMDVFAEEPAIDSKLIQLPNFIPTPHIAGNSQAAVLAMGRSAISHLESFFYGAAK
jgi:phosphoglycerate dehydrogenase-like enzyme